MTIWPPINSKAWLLLPCCNEEHPTRIEDITEEDCLVAEPLAPHKSPISTDNLRPGFFLGWASGRGATERPVELVEKVQDRVPMWQLHSVGDPIETQRRRYVRVDCAIDISLHLLETGAPIHTKTKSLSEGGLSCAVDTWAIDPRGRIFNAEVTVQGKTHVARSQIAWWGNLGEDDSRLIGLRFVEMPPKSADEIRSFVFSEQLRQRRSAQ